MLGDCELLEKCSASAASRHDVHRKGQVVSLCEPRFVGAVFRLKPSVRWHPGDDDDAVPKKSSSETFQVRQCDEEWALAGQLAC